MSGHFDTNIGMKVESSSYTKIASAIKRPPSRILFISDNVNEIHAAIEAGLQVVISYRPGNAPLSLDAEKSLLVAGERVRVICSFTELLYSPRL